MNQCIGQERALGSVLTREVGVLALVVWLGASGWVARSAEARVVHLYDDLGRLARVVDVSTGECAVYHYDAVGNILSISRERDCAQAPAVDSVLEVNEEGVIVVRGRHLLGATVSAEIPGLYVSEVRSGDTEVRFRMQGSEVVCASDGVATITTAFGSVQAGFSIPGARRLVLGRVAADVLSGPGATNFYCLDLAVPLSVVVEAVPIAGSGLLPCVGVYADIRGAPVPDGSACATESEPFAVADTFLPAGSYVVAVSGTNATAGGFTLVVKPPLVFSTGPGVEVAVSDGQGIRGWAVSLAVPTIEVVAPGHSESALNHVVMARPVVDVVFPSAGQGREGGGLTVAVPPVEVRYEGAAGVRASGGREVTKDGVRAGGGR